MHDILIWIGIPKPHSRRFRHFSWKTTCLFPKGVFQPIFVNIYCYYLFGKTPYRHGMQFHVEKWSSFVLNSHLYLIGDQKDVQYLIVCCVYLAYLLLHLLQWLHYSSSWRVTQGQLGICSNTKMWILVLYLFWWVSQSNMSSRCFRGKWLTTNVN